jgi:hypothetical protein
MKTNQDEVDFRKSAENAQKKNLKKNKKYLLFLQK